MCLLGKVEMAGDIFVSFYFFLYIFSIVNYRRADRRNRFNIDIPGKMRVVETNGWCVSVVICSLQADQHIQSVTGIHCDY